MSVNKAIIVTCEFLPFPGGIATYGARLADELHQAGIGVRVIAPRYGDQASEPVRVSYQVDRVLKHHTIGPVEALRVAKILGRADPGTVFLATDIRTVFLLAAISQFRGLKFRAAIHGSEVSKFAGGRRNRMLGSAFKWAYSRATRVLANSQATLDLFEKALGRSSKNVVAYLGVEPNWFAAPPPIFESEILASASRKRDHIVCTVGRIEPRKGQLQAVRAISTAVKRTEQEITYVVAGVVVDTSYKNRLQEEAERLGVSLILPGRISDDDLRKLYRISLAHLLCAVPLDGKIEGFGMVLLEAAAQRCPSITTAVGGIPEVVGSTWDLLVPSNDHDLLVDRLIFLVQNSAAREDLGLRAYERAKLFSWRACAEAAFPELMLGHTSI